MFHQITGKCNLRGTVTCNTVVEQKKKEKKNTDLLKYLRCSIS